MISSLHPSTCWISALSSGSIASPVALHKYNGADGARHGVRLQTLSISLSRCYSLRHATVTFKIYFCLNFILRFLIFFICFKSFLLILKSKSQHRGAGVLLSMRVRFSLGVIEILNISIFSLW